MLSERITAYLAGVQEKLRRAELARVEERGRRRLTTGAAAAILTIAALAGGGWYWIERGRQASRVTAVAAVAEARLLGEQAQGGCRRDRPLGRGSGGGKASRRFRGRRGDRPLRHAADQLVSQLEDGQREADKDRRLLKHLEDIRLAAADEFDAKRTAHDFAAAFDDAGLKIGSVDPADAARWMRGRRNPVELASYLDWWAAILRAAKGAESDSRSLVAIARLVDPDPWRDQLRMIYEKPANASDLLRKLASDESLERQSATSLYALALLTHSRLNAVSAERILRKAAARHPGDFWVNYELGQTHYRPPNDPEGDFRDPLTAVRYSTAAAAWPSTLQPETLWRSRCLPPTWCPKALSHSARRSD